MKAAIALSLLGCVSGFSGEAFAADWGACAAEGGMVYDYPVAVNVDVNDASKNTAGTELKLATTWANGTRFNMVCECPDPSTYTKEVDTYVWGQSLLSVTTRKINGEQYYRLVPELEVMTMIQAPNVMVHVPQKNVQIPNNYNAHDCTGGNNGQYGSNGYLSFVISKPIEGEVDIPKTTVVALYATKKKGTYSSQPISTVSISGRLTITQGCEIKPGTVLDVPFGEYPSSAFKNRRGQAPVGGTEHEINLGFDCNNISDGIKVSLRLEGTTNSADNRAVDMGNPDIGVLVKDSSGKVLIPNDANSTTLLDLSRLDTATHRNATIRLLAIPISTTGNAPQGGTFEGVTTVHLEME
ncbi:fimbrial protein [Escherichia sp. E2748]|uniref:fimbrial protein n=1 Tax=Escherichia sp. E2748 TaxID=2044460 RepID=UPI0010815F90|nr:fimbrial protein [Escherichia sp. E2748]TGB90764.1 fimbrial protein [Escherichia sp. E2748]TLI82523.1 fimbrial protein [Escherichia sp. E2748]